MQVRHSRAIDRKSARADRFQWLRWRNRESEQRAKRDHAQPMSANSAATTTAILRSQIIGLSSRKRCDAQKLQDQSTLRRFNTASPETGLCSESAPKSA